MKEYLAKEVVVNEYLPQSAIQPTVHVDGAEPQQIVGLERTVVTLQELLGLYLEQKRKVVPFLPQEAQVVLYDPTSDQTWWGAYRGGSFVECDRIPNKYKPDPLDYVAYCGKLRCSRQLGANNLDYLLEVGNTLEYGGFHFTFDGTCLKPKEIKAEILPSIDPRSGSGGSIWYVHWTVRQPFGLKDRVLEKVPFDEAVQTMQTWHDDNCSPQTFTEAAKHYDYSRQKMSGLTSVEFRKQLEKYQPMCPIRACRTSYVNDPDWDLTVDREGINFPNLFTIDLKGNPGYARGVVLSFPTNDPNVWMATGFSEKPKWCHEGEASNEYWFFKGEPDIRHNGRMVYVFREVVDDTVYFQARDGSTLTLPRVIAPSLYDFLEE